MAVLELTKVNFDKVIADNDIVLIDFWAEWCEPCKAFAVVYARLAEEYPSLIFGKVDIQQEPELADDFNIRSIPQLIVIRQNIVVASETGAMPADILRDLIEQVSALDMNKLRKELENEERGDL
ncbi:MAG: thioredoxin [Gammaproteobacteria bacterium]